jgi:carbonic anhydrase
MGHLVTRRKFVGLLGLVGCSGLPGIANAAGSAADALAQILKESRPQREKDKAQTPHSENRAKPSDEQTTQTAARAAKEDPEEIWNDLMQGNKRFVTGKPKPRPLVAGRGQFYQSQDPSVIVLGCADSRVSPELVFDKTLGDLFVVRTAGNITDAIALGSIEYAAEHLHCKALVVLGHEKCGAVAAAVAGEKMATPNLDAIVNKIAPVIEPFRGCAQGEQLLGLAVEANVKQSAREVVENSPILQNLISEAKLKLITAVYRVKTGEVYRLS